MITIELHGVPRLRAGCARVDLDAATIASALQGLVKACPDLASTLRLDGTLHPAYAVNLNGDRFVTDPNTALEAGDVLILLAADAGG
jgi:molybdopterin converting factor small subunit